MRKSLTVKFSTVHFCPRLVASEPASKAADGLLSGLYEGQWVEQPDLLTAVEPSPHPGQDAPKKTGPIPSSHGPHGAAFFSLDFLRGSFRIFKEHLWISKGVRMNPWLGVCPVCGEGLEVVALQCPACETRIEGRFRMSRLARLNAEQLAFVELFLRSEGKFTQLERMTGLSYPTLRKRLQEILRAMGFEAEAEAPPGPQERAQNLEALAEGRISYEEALRRLRGVGSSEG